MFHHSYQHSSFRFSNVGGFAFFVGTGDLVCDVCVDGSIMYAFTLNFDTSLHRLNVARSLTLPFIVVELGPKLKQIHSPYIAIHYPYIVPYIAHT